MSIHWVDLNYLPVLLAAHPQLKLKVGPLYAYGNIPNAIADSINAQDANAGTPASLIFKPEQSTTVAE
jgi:hypothetical protein